MYRIPILTRRERTNRIRIYSQNLYWTWGESSKFGICRLEAEMELTRQRASPHFLRPPFLSSSSLPPETLLHPSISSRNDADPHPTNTPLHRRLAQPDGAFLQRKSQRPRLKHPQQRSCDLVPTTAPSHLPLHRRISSYPRPVRPRFSSRRGGHTRPCPRRRVYRLYVG